MFFYKTSLDNQQVKLTQLGSKSVVQKTIALEGAKVNITIMVHKATKTKEMERATITT